MHIACAFVFSVQPRCIIHISDIRVPPLDNSHTGIVLLNANHLKRTFIIIKISSKWNVRSNWILKSRIIEREWTRDQYNRHHSPITSLLQYILNQIIFNCDASEKLFQPENQNLMHSSETSVSVLCRLASFMPQKKLWNYCHRWKKITFPLKWPK